MEKARAVERGTQCEIPAGVLGTIRELSPEVRATASATEVEETGSGSKAQETASVSEVEEATAVETAQQTEQTAELVEKFTQTLTLDVSPSERRPRGRKRARSCDSYLVRKEKYRRMFDRNNS
ncbi:hypothetical protein Zmor_002853 [Zophobas morio]|uniref:Uncharacterized protein n=1 Tax=Zophobas morio TaxID=2755281 RepID=A0AA38HKB1_9CUCU|nr:hypothetical protein Zmor_002853 [Zophobas morio]